MQVVASIEPAMIMGALIVVIKDTAISHSGSYQRVGVHLATVLMLFLEDGAYNSKHNLDWALSEGQTASM